MPKLRAEDFFNVYFYSSLVLAIIYITIGYTINLFLDSVAFVITVYFIFLLIAVMLINTQCWWNSSQKTSKENKDE